MKVLITITLLLISSIFHNSYAQYKPLTIGDTIPELVLRNVYNHKTDTIKLSQLNGKTVIIDFWNTTCIPCLKAFPLIDSLQAVYSENVQFLAVSRKEMAETEVFFDTRPFVHRPSIPFITSDTILHSLFPHLGVPYYVWIDGQGVVRHLTRGDKLTEENLREVIVGRKDAIENALPTTVRETVVDSLFERDVEFLSYLLRYNTASNLHLVKPQSSHAVLYSGSVKRLYQFLYSRLGNISFDPFQPQRTRLQVSDDMKYRAPTDKTQLSEWRKRYYYRYQCLLPKTWEGNVFDVVKADFERYFPIRAFVSKEPVDCLVLRRTDDVDRLKTKGGLQTHTFYGQDIRQEKMDSVRHYLNGDFSLFSNSFGVRVEHISSMPFFDDTNYSGKVDISFPGDVLDNPTIEGFRQALGKYGLELVNETRVLDVLVLSDR